VWVNNQVEKVGMQESSRPHTTNKDLPKRGGEKQCSCQSDAALLGERPEKVLTY